MFSVTTVTSKHCGNLECNLELENLYLRFVEIERTWAKRERKTFAILSQFSFRTLIFRFSSAPQCLRQLIILITDWLCLFSSFFHQRSINNWAVKFGDKLWELAETMTKAKEIKQVSEWEKPHHDDWRELTNQESLAEVATNRRTLRCRSSENAFVGVQST